MKTFLRFFASVILGALLVGCSGGSSSSSSSSGKDSSRLDGKVLGSGSPSGSFRFYDMTGRGTGSVDYYVSTDGSGTAVAKGNYRFTSLGDNMGNLIIYNLRNTSVTSSATNFYIHGPMEFTSANQCYWEMNYSVSGGDASEGVSGDTGGGGYTINADGTVMNVKKTSGEEEAGDRINYIISGWGTNGTAAYTFTITDAN